MISRAELSKSAYEAGASDRTIEKDYVIGRLLFGIADSPLKKLLAFKGGTSLKKIYFPDYRYSEDLDFTLLKEVNTDALIFQFKKILPVIEKATALTLNLPDKRIERRTDSLTCYVEFVGPLLAKPGSRDIKVDFTFDEIIVFPLNKKPINTPYSDNSPQPGNMSVYALEEVLTEKLCALIGRTEPRDLYDTHFLLYTGGLDYHSVPHAFIKKAGSKGVDCKTLGVVLKGKEGIMGKLWETRLRHQVRELPPLGKVLRETRKMLRRYQIL